MRFTNDGSMSGFGSVCLACGYWKERISKPLLITLRIGLLLQRGNSVFIGLLKNLVACAQQVLLHDGQALGFVSLENIDPFNKNLQKIFDHLWTFRDRLPEYRYLVGRFARSTYLRMISEMEPARDTPMVLPLRFSAVLISPLAKMPPPTLFILIATMT
jgi:hypothetical protein